MKKEHLPLVIGLSIPVLLVVVLAAIIYVPRLYLKPQFDFVYATGSYPSYVDREGKIRVDYTVVNDRLVKMTVPVEISSDPQDRYYYSLRESTPPIFYHYDVSEQKNIPLSEAEVVALHLNPAQEAPDGFKIGYGRDSDDIFESIFGGRDYSERVLTKGSVSIPLNLVKPGEQYYSSDFDFIGWVAS